MTDRIIVITGGYGRLGRCFARAFVAAGDHVVLTGRDTDKLAAAATELDCAEHRQLDVSDRAQIAALREHLAAGAGRVDVLLNNAASFAAWGPLEELDETAFEEALRTNIVGPCALTRALLPLLEAAPAPLVVNVASTSGHRADPQTPAYNAAKFGLLGFTEAIRKDLRRRGIRVSSLSPSAIAFDEDAAEGGKGARLHGDDVADTARWLADAPLRALVRDVELWATNP